MFAWFVLTFVAGFSAGVITVDVVRGRRGY